MPVGLVVMLVLTIGPFVLLPEPLIIRVVVPFYGMAIASVVITRLMALPRRDWPPRPDERRRVVGMAGSDGAYELAR